MDGSVKRRMLHVLRKVARLAGMRNAIGSRLPCEWVTLRTTPRLILTRLVTGQRGAIASHGRAEPNKSRGWRIRAGPGGG